LGTLALARKLNVDNLAFVELRVVHLDEAFARRAVLSLHTFTVLVCDFLVSCVFMPRPEVAIDIKVSLKARLFTESEAKLALDRVYECKGGNSNQC
jgi:hypothetical protein